jgi:hypothetical protein
MELTEENIIKTVQDAFDKRSHEAAIRNRITVGSVRDYDCDVPGCNRPGYAKGKCHAHSRRVLLGKPVDTPLRNRNNGSKCTVCGVAQNGKGGWTLCAKHFKIERFLIVKQALIDLMGGECSVCGGVFPHRVFDFHHHSGEKEISMSRSLINKSLETVAKEAVKCVLLCANCHRLEHNNGEI